MKRFLFPSRVFVFSVYQYAVILCLLSHNCIDSRNNEGKPFSLLSFGFSIRAYGVTRRKSLCVFSERIRVIGVMKG